MDILALSLSELTQVDTDSAVRIIAVFSGVSMVGVIWLIINVFKLARNQVKLSLMLRELLEQRRS